MADDEQVLYLHGDLDLQVFGARSLPKMGFVSSGLRRCFASCDASRSTPEGDSDGNVSDISGTGSSRGHRNRKLHHHRNMLTCDPYVTISVPHATLARTRVISNSHNPEWNERFHIPLAHPMAFLDVRVKDNDVVGADIMGKLLIPAETIASGKEISEWFQLSSSSGKPLNPDTSLRLKLKFTPCEETPPYRHGIAGDPLHRGVSNTYFPLRKGSSVTLYQDAHVSNGSKIPEIELDNGLIREHGTCWEDICSAIAEAHRLVYIVGWSVFHKVKLIRERTRPLPRGGDLTLGELLKYKSEEGVRVLLLVWDDKT